MYNIPLCCLWVLSGSFFRSQTKSPSPGFWKLIILREVKISKCKLCHFVTVLFLVSCLLWWFYVYPKLYVDLGYSSEHFLRFSEIFLSLFRFAIIIKIFLGVFRTHRQRIQRTHARIVYNRQRMYIYYGMDFIKKLLILDFFKQSCKIFVYWILLFILLLFFIFFFIIFYNFFLFFVYFYY